MDDGERLNSFMNRFGPRLVENGYSVIPIWPGHKKPGRFQNGEWRDLADWQRYCDRLPTRLEVNIWKMWPGAAIGVACGAVVALDIDVLDNAVATQIEQMTRRMIGDTPAIRIGLAPKRVLLYRADKPFAGIKKHPLEVLARGQQFVAYAIHPDTGQPYYWPNEDLTGLHIASLPPITEDEAHEWARTAWEMLPPHLRQASLDSKRGPTAWQGPTDLRGTYEAVKSAMAYIPNDALDWDSWIRVGLALKGALGEEGRDLWLDWSANCSKSGKSGKSDTAAKEWARFKPTKIGAGTLYFLAEQAGWSPSDDLTLNGHRADQLAEAAEGDHPAAAFLAGLQVNVPVSAATLAGTSLERHAAQPAQAVVRGPPLPVAFPYEMLKVGGVIGQLMHYCTSTAPSPQPFLALGAALCAVGVLAGRKYRTRTNLRSNLYVAGIADSGGGKDQARVCIKNALYAAGLDRYLGGEEIASGSALLTSLKRHPCRLFQIDELGKFLGSVSGKKGSQHKADAWTNLTKLYTSAGGVYLGTEYADQDTRPRVDIQQPCAALYGVTVPGTFWEAVEGGAMQDGSLARFLIFLSPEDYPVRNKRPADDEVPVSLIAALQAVADGVPGHDGGGNLAETMAATIGTKPYVVPATQDADDALDQLIDDQTTMLREAPDGAHRAIMARLWENVSKVAMIAAISRDPAAPVIMASDVAWARGLVEYCISTILTQADRFMASNETEARHKKVMHIIRAAEGITKTELARKTQFLTTRERAEIVAALIESQSIGVTQSMPEGGTKPMTIYKASSG